MNRPEQSREAAGYTCRDWQDSDEARAILKRLATCEEVIAALTGCGIDTSGLEDEILQAECELDNLRSAAIEDALCEIGGDPDQDQIDELEDEAITVNQLRLNARKQGLVTVEITELPEGRARIAA